MANVSTPAPAPAPEKSGAKKLWLIVGPVIGVLVLLVVILAVVPVDARVKVAAKTVGEVQIIKNGSFDLGPRDAKTVSIAENDKIAVFLDAYTDASKHSVGWGILNNQWATKAKKTGQKFGADDCKAILGTEAEPLVVIRCDKQSARIAGESVDFDLILFRVRATSNRLQTYSFWLIDSAVVYETDTLSAAYDEYVAYEYKGVMNGSELLDYIGKLA